MNYAEIISKLRDNKELTASEIAFIVNGITFNDMSDAQVGSFAMAVLWRGLSEDNTVNLTKAMRDSGDVLAWDVDGVLVDKHSTGGVGDCVSLALAPILAAAGLFVPMISGRGLGHTGGTLDKLESMDGFSTNLSYDVMQAQLQKIGVVMAGQSATIAPADKRLYAIRDITGTVPSSDLITASILSKKLAAGLDHLVLDIKCGLGSFMKTIDEAQLLAKKLVTVANNAGCQTKGYITNMNLPLCKAAGNSLEVKEILALLKGELNDSNLFKVTKILCVSLMESSNIENSNQVFDMIVSSGKALEKFEEMVFAQGGPKSLEAIEANMKETRWTKEITAKQDGEFFGFDAYEIGMSVVELGGGRAKQEDLLDYAVGVSDILEPQYVRKGDLLARIHANDDGRLKRAEMRLEKAMLSSEQSNNIILGEVT